MMAPNNPVSGDQLQVRTMYDDFMETGTLDGVIEEGDESSGEEETTQDDDDECSTKFSNDCDNGGEVNQKRANEMEQERQSLGKKETMAVHSLRVVVGLVLFAAALIVCLGIYFYVRNDQQSDFEFVFESSATQVMKSFHASVSRIAAGADAMSVSITAFALQTNATWPMVTVPFFELHASAIRAMTKSVNCAFIPLVKDEDRAEWEAYVTQQIQEDNNLLESFEREEQFMLAQDENFAAEHISFSAPPGNPLATRNFSEAITRLRPDPETKEFQQPNQTGPYLPFYQTSPVLPLPALPNMNVFSFPPLAPPARNVLETNMPTLADNHIPLAMFNMFLARGQFRHERHAWVGDGATNFFYPVFDSFDPSTRELVGLVLTNIYWRLHFQDILPTNARGIIAVVENTVNQTYTYRLDGSEVTFLGVGDLHDPKYDHMHIQSDLNVYLEDTAGPSTESYTRVPLSDAGGVEYCLHIYPSQEMQDEYTTSDATIFALIVAVVFVFTSLVFLAYNTVVERRQKVVFDRAVKSAAVVSNLFPKEVREELINNNAGPCDSNKKSAKDKEAWKTSSAMANGGIANPSQGRIAKRYNNVTIMFADIAGFTSWSANRRPDDVFVLLETFYAAFDSLAVRRNVFKVEAIGDVYMAVTGLPNPQKDHALRMAKFARDCIQRVGIMTSQLAPTLGNETLSLGLRVGLHSGDVTGGVLRGDKSRFQLFGDAVNTAARMEARGLLGTVHISEATYKALAARGKRHLARPREETASAYGNGEVEQTYFLTQNFVHPGSATAVLSTVSTQKVGNKSLATASDTKSMTTHSYMDYTEASSSRGGMDNIYDVDVDTMIRKLPPASSMHNSGGNDADSVSTRDRPHWQQMVAQVDSYTSLEDYVPPPEDEQPPSPPTTAGHLHSLDC